MQNIGSKDSHSKGLISKSHSLFVSWDFLVVLNDECTIKKEKFLQWNDHYVREILSKIVIKHLGLHGPLTYVS